ncbi:MAG TPA: serine/threonine-protein kinase [Phycisphaerae bacterium]|nr:serine/threonine-protein kinase [Phycisphaerae bacterium]
MSACPPLHVLEDAAVGKANGDGGISSHLACCAPCRSTLEDIRQNNALLTQITTVARATRSRRERRLDPLVMDDYEILECVAQGGQGVVYRAIQKRTKRCVALKMLHGGHFATPRQRGRFEREVELAAGLHHPNIVTVHDSGITPDGRPFLSMAFIEGRPLDQWARSCRAESTVGQTRTRLLEVFIKVCRALSFAHLRGVLHRDLKPGNILVDANHEPHIVDFGLAKLVDGEAAFSATLTGEFMGTIAYAAPEQVSCGGSQGDARSDVYALGVLLYEVLTGQLPFPVSGAIADVVRQITTTEPSAPSRVIASIPADLDTITLKAMAKDMNRRYQSALDLGEDLRRFLANEPIIARSDSTWYVLRKVAHRHRRTLVAGAAVTFALLMGAVAMTAYVVFSARASAARSQAIAELERADALSLVMHSIVQPRSANSGREDYASRDMNRFEEQIRLGWLAGSPRRESIAASLLAGVYLEGGALWPAEELTRKANIWAPHETGANQREAARGLSNLAEVLLARKRLSEAIHYCERALAIDKESTGKGGIEAARDAELLARIYLAKGEFDTASVLATDAVSVQSAKLGEESSDLARSLDTQAAVLLALGRFEAAQSACLRALKIRLTVLQDEDSAVGQSLRRLAAIIERSSGDAVHLAIAKSIGAETYTELGAGLRSLADDLGHLEMPRGAGATSPTPVSVLHRMLALKEALLGPLHKGLLSTLASLGVEAHFLQDYAGEVDIMTRALTVIEKIQGPRSLAFINCLDGRADVLAGMERYSEAIPDRERSLTIWWTLPADQRDDFHAAVNERALALWMSLDGRYEQAAQRFGHCIEIISRAQGTDQHVVAYCHAGRAWALSRLGRTEGVESEAREALELGEQLKESMPVGQRSCLTYFAGSVLAAQGKLDEGQQLIQLAWEGDAYHVPLQKRLPDDRFRRQVVEDMIRICVTRGDANGEGRWRKELQGNRK